jgi:hypothetical protein
MQYFRIQFDDGESLLQEVYAGQVLRYCDDFGVTVDSPQGGSQNMGQVTPDFTPPPDPVPVVCDTPSVVDTPVATVVTTRTDLDILGAPLRTWGYDDKGQLVRIDYPRSGTYQMLEHSDGRLRKITEVSPSGICFERYFYYDNWGRVIEETQL